MRQNVTIDTTKQGQVFVVNLSGFEADAVSLINQTACPIYLSPGTSVSANTESPTTVFIPPLSNLATAITGANFAYIVGPPIATSTSYGTIATARFTAGEALPTYTAMPITNVDANITNGTLNVSGTVTATFPPGTTVDANITNSVINTNTNITNASLPISGSVNAEITNASINAQVVNTTLETNAGPLAGNDDISGSPFIVAAGASAGTLGPWDAASWGGIALTAIMPVSVSYSTNGSSSKLTVETSQDSTTWYPYQYFVLTSGSTANITLPRAGRYFRISYTATSLGFVVFARFMRTEVLSESLIVPYVPGVKADFNVLVAGDSWQFQAGLLSDSTEILYLLVTSPGPSTVSDNVIGFALGDENTPSPELIIAYSEANAGNNRIELGPFTPGQGIATRGYTIPALFTGNQANMSYTIWYR